MFNWTLLTQFPLYAQCTMLYLCMEWTCCPVSLHLLVQSADFIILFPSIKLAPLSFHFCGCCWCRATLLGQMCLMVIKLPQPIFPLSGIESERSHTNCHFQLEPVFAVFRVWWFKNNAPWKEQHSHNLFRHHQWFVCLYGWIDYRVESSRKTTFILRERLIYTIHHSLANLRAELSSPVIYQLWSSYFLFHNWTLSKFDSNHMHPDSLNNPCQLSIFCFKTLFVLLVW